MQELFTRSKTTINNQKGTIIIITSLIILSLAFLLIIMVEFGRTMIVREQLQTAADSAALAAANSGTHRFVILEVTTDMGDEESTDSEGNSTCVSCGTTTVRTPPMDEQELIDEGGWREFCAPECSCGGGGCEYKIIDRWLQYDIEAMALYIDPSQIQQSREDLTSAMRTIIPFTDYSHRSQIAKTIQGASLERLIQLLSSRHSWANEYFMRNGYWNDYCTPTYSHPRYGYGCEKHQAEALDTFYKVRAKLDRVLSMKETIDRISNPKYQQSVNLTADDAAGQFFQANLPKHAEQSYINQVDVYNHTQMNSPYYPSVVIHATAKIKSLFPEFFGTDGYTTGICAQGSTYYKDSRDEKDIVWGNPDARWSSAPEDACWVMP